MELQEWWLQFCKLSSRHPKHHAYSLGSYWEPFIQHPCDRHGAKVFAFIISFDSHDSLQGIISFNLQLRKPRCIEVTLIPVSLKMADLTLSHPDPSSRLSAIHCNHHPT